MYDMDISAAANALGKIVERSPIDWTAFDAVLLRLPDINAFDESLEETILSDFFHNDIFFEHGEALPEAVRHFLSCGYDVSANDGRNGGVALSALCWSSYDRYILDAAKVLLDAGAPVIYRSEDDTPGTEPEGLFGSLDFKLGGAWNLDNDYSFANILEAYKAMAKAYADGKDYRSVSYYFDCIGRTLTAVSVSKNDRSVFLRPDGPFEGFAAPLALWFDDLPLVIDPQTELVVNPVYTEDNRETLEDVSSAFSGLIGAKLRDVGFIDVYHAFLVFDNGCKLDFTYREGENWETSGTGALVKTAP